MLIVAALGALAVIFRDRLRPLLDRLRRSEGPGRRPLRIALLALTLACCATGLAVLEAEADEGPSVQVTIRLRRRGAVYVYLVDEAGFRVPRTGLRSKRLPVDEAALRRGWVRVRFDGLAPGTYGVRCFQDLDGDGELKRGLFGPKEPWGMSWRDGKPARWPSFDDMRFELTGGLHALTIELHG